MPNIKHVVQIDYKPTFRSEKVAGMFDVPVAEKLKREWEINIPIEDRPWQIGVIVGASGAGKTTLAKKIFGENNYHKEYLWNKSNLLDDFAESLNIKDIVNTLNHVGFSSPPNWLLPHAVLSNGQKFRCEIARALLERENLIVFDEFTSVVDRNVAKIGSAAIAKYIKKTDKQFVAVSCHYDILDWLEPDWVLDVSENNFTWSCLRRPKLQLEIYQCHTKIWQLFKGHHYLSADINKSALCYVAFFNDIPVAMTAVLAFPHNKVKNFWKEHRTVVLPDYQGVGIGNRLSEAVGDILLSKGKRYLSVTSHPSMILHRVKSKKWCLKRGPSHVNFGKNAKHNINKSSSVARLSCSFEYIGDLDSIKK